VQSITPGRAPGAPPAGFERSFRGGRPRKRWRYVGIFGEQLMACAAIVKIGPVRQSFWALWMPDGRGLRERTRMIPRSSELSLDGGRLRIADLGVALDLRLDEREGVQARCPHGAQEVWTHKQAGVGLTGTLSVDGGATVPVEALAVIDDTAGYHARVTEWRWTAGVGVDPQGVPLAWNLVSGVNDPQHGSERAVWVDGVAQEAVPVSFTEDLTSLMGDDGSRLRFQALAERSRRDNLLVASSDYRSPFGTFTGKLPGGHELGYGYGVMEHHRARW
jgi:hypothetical protein